jgi:hypothetical protein
MEDLKPYLGHYEDKPVFLNYGKYGWYLKFDDKLYSVPKCFHSANFDWKKAIKIIDYKNKKVENELTESKIVKQLDCDNNKRVSILKGDENIRQGKAKDYIKP